MLPDSHSLSDDAPNSAVATISQESETTTESKTTSVPADDFSQPVSTTRVLHVINGEHYSGAERVQDLLGLSLPSFGYEVGFACLKPAEFSRYRQAVECPLEAIPMRGRFDLRPARRLAQMARNGGYALLHAHTPRTLFLTTIAARMARLPIVYHVHSPASNDSTRWWQDHLNATVEWFCMRRADGLIPVSESLGERLLKAGFSKNKVHPVPNGVPYRTTRDPRNLDQKDWTLGMVALFRPRKGTEVLLKALAQLRREGHPVRLLAVGGFETSEYESNLRALVRSLEIEEAVTWTGFTKEVDRELLKMDLMVLPSLFGEGTPMVMLEAMAAGVPIVASRVEGIPEVVRDRQEGLLVTPNDPQGLAGAVTRFIQHEVDWTEMHQAAIERHATHYSVESMARQVADVYQKILD